MWGGAEVGEKEEVEVGETGQTKSDVSRTVVAVERPVQVFGDESSPHALTNCFFELF
jgi:hypothetical protein